MAFKIKGQRNAEPALDHAVRQWMSFAPYGRGKACISSKLYLTTHYEQVEYAGKFSKSQKNGSNQR
ncbi:MAG: hypothetical protein MJ056_06530 [Akkermansia sp.]|nr:hypothetical protein [Akkermansia sp.]